MKTYTSLFIAFLLVLITSSNAKSQNCSFRDLTHLMSEEQLKVLKAGSYDWMRNAMVCQMGEFEIASPSENNESDANIIFVFRKGKPVFYRHNSGTDIFSPKLDEASLDKVMVQIWHGGDNGDIKKIWYQTVGKNKEVMAFDINFDGQPDYKTIYKNDDILEMYEWKNDKWQRKKLKKIP